MSESKFKFKFNHLLPLLLCIGFFLSPSLSLSF
ncbi:hypothetical protein BRADI_4g07602v3 [Brachypodium distachyon]|uniref:Uncharacterized protein n=1 Tax=Brachypodium distachyon TaxID=15368 RepID=A0A2K2CL20_BRADI|nr:hypothetical protein BRADI_4g07602v3 [Brachypodium distachyon]